MIGFLIRIIHFNIDGSSSGHQAEAAKKIYHGESIKGKYILCVEGSVPLGDDGNYCELQEEQL